MTMRLIFTAELCSAALSIRYMHMHMHEHENKHGKVLT